MRVNETVGGWLKRNQSGGSFSTQHQIRDPYISSNVIEMQAWAYARTLRNLDAADRQCVFVHGDEIAEYRRRKLCKQLRRKRNGAKSSREKSTRPLETAFDLLQRVREAEPLASHQVPRSMR
jgi:hypothetical protein